MFRTLKDVVMCKHLGVGAATKKTSPTGVDYVGNYNSLLATEVVGEGPNDIHVGDKVYVLATAARQAWAKERIEFEGQLCIFVPLSEVKLVESAVRVDPRGAVTGTCCSSGCGLCKDAGK